MNKFSNLNKIERVLEEQNSYTYKKHKLGLEFIIIL
jgi:hypothetical protein